MHKKEKGFELYSPVKITIASKEIVVPRTSLSTMRGSEPMAENKLEGITTLVSPDLRRWVRIQAALNEQTQSSFIRTLLERTRETKGEIND